MATKTYTLIVKGGAEAAELAARDHNVPAAYVRMADSPFVQAVLEVDLDHATEAGAKAIGRIANWFNADAKRAPRFEPGDLLAYWTDPAIDTMRLQDERWPD